MLSVSGIAEVKCVSSMTSYTGSVSIVSVISGSLGYTGGSQPYRVLFHASVGPEPPDAKLAQDPSLSSRRLENSLGGGLTLFLNNLFLSKTRTRTTPIATPKAHMTPTKMATFPGSPTSMDSCDETLKVSASVVAAF